MSAGDQGLFSDLFGAPDHDYVELIGGPLDGIVLERSGREYHVPVRPRPIVSEFSDGDELSTELLAIKRHVYRGFMWNPDRCHGGLRYVGVECG